MNKNNFTLRLAGLFIKLNTVYEYTFNHTSGYFCEDVNKIDFSVSVSEDEILREQNGDQFPKDYCEYICLYRKIAENLPLFNRVVFHGAVITYEEDAFLFTAPSGTGKSTHINLWKRYLKEKIDIVNGDKPILEFRKHDIYAYGTPWAGKENLQKNRCAPLKGICVLKQAKTNSTRRLNPSEALYYFLNQIYLPKNEEAASVTLGFLDTILKELPVYLLECDISEEAVMTSYEALTGNIYKAGEEINED